MIMHQTTPQLYTPEQNSIILRQSKRDEFSFIVSQYMKVIQEESSTAVKFNSCSSLNT